jgi:hypothetical protein
VVVSICLVVAAVAAAKVVERRASLELARAGVAVPTLRHRLVRVERAVALEPVPKSSLALQGRSPACLVRLEQRSQEALLVASAASISKNFTTIEGSHGKESRKESRTA